MRGLSDQLLASLLSAATKTEIHAREDLARKRKGENRPVDLANLHSILLERGRVSRRCSRSVVHECIFVKKLDGTIIPIVCPLTETVGDVKRLISVIENIHPRRQRLYYGSKQLEDSKRLSQYDIAIGSTLHLCISLRRTDAIRHYVDPKFRSPQFDYDFRNIDDSGIEFRRGGFVYMRPIGTYRIALNVLNRYGDNSWLGVNGRPSIFSEVPGDWLVIEFLSYHGTGKNNALSIAGEGYLLCKGHRFLFGHGIYSTPDFAVALRYAATFTHENERYKFVIQNRVNPKTVIRVPTSVTGAGEYWICEEEKDIRPYGICFVKC